MSILERKIYRSMNMLPFNCQYRGRKEEGMCGEVVRIEFRVAGKVTAGLVLELDDNVVGELVLCGWW